MEFERDHANCTITMSQSKYIEEVLKRFNMEECKPIGTPLDVNSKLLKLMEEEFQGIQEEMQVLETTWKLARNESFNNCIN